jgi:predicted nucleic acid-binding protein
MGSLIAVAGSHVYLDTNIIIYAVEGAALARPSLLHLLSQVDAGVLTATTSELTLAEVLVRPLRDGNAVLADAYRRSISNGAALRIARVSRVVLERAAALRAAQASLKLPDAIHAATALLAGCTTFLSNDARFESVAGLPVLLLSKLP